MRERRTGEAESSASCLRIVARGGDHAGEVATRSPLVTAPDALLVEALGVMNANKRTVLLVTDTEDHLVGLVHIHDALRAGVA